MCSLSGDSETARRKVVVDKSTIEWLIIRYRTEDYLVDLLDFAGCISTKYGKSRDTMKGM